MIRLPAALDAWNSPEFVAVLKREIDRLDGGRLPLQQGLTASSQALDDRFEAMIIGADDEAGFIRARVGIFFSGLITGCSCADDPTPVEPQNEYCELIFAIDKATAEATVTLLAD
jgi:hypothetical protein